ncbi:MAG: alanine racemase [Elusimicrobia bacterium]|nr:alanine racemase [Elusimicrobiota bacterium]
MVPGALNFYRPTWVEVSLSAMEGNLRRLRERLTSGAQVLPVVKADGYGHGALEIARRFSAVGVYGFGVSSLEEALRLREGGIQAPLLLLGSLYPLENIRPALQAGIDLTVASLEAAEELVRISQELRCRARAHLKVDTGMGRIGVSPSGAPGVLEALGRSSWVELEGIYSHFSCADSDPEYSRSQLEAFLVLKREVLSHFKPRTPVRFHMANSAAILKFPESHLDLVRPGLALYGLMEGFDPALSWKSRVVFLKTVGKGARIGYDGGFRTSRISRIATLPVGYADGIFRRLSSRGSVLIRGRRYPIVGHVTMDMLMVDVTDLKEAGVGEETVLIGSQGKSSISVQEVAGWAERIPYEVVCGISARVPRVYV